MLTFVALFPIVDPLESAPFFLDLTRSCSVAERNATAWRVTRYSFFLLLGSMVLGPSLLVFFGIDLAVVRIAGGLVVTSIGWKLLSKGDDQWSGGAVAEAEVNAKPAMQSAGSFYPLTMPLTVGPGSMSIAITIGSHYPAATAQLSRFVLYMSGALIGLLAIGAAIYISYRFAANIARVLGKTGVEVMVRLSAFILMCIGIQIIWNGSVALMPSLLH